MLPVFNGRTSPLVATGCDAHLSRQKTCHVIRLTINTHDNLEFALTYQRALRNQSSKAAGYLSKYDMATYDEQFTHGSFTTVTKLREAECDTLSPKRPDRLWRPKSATVYRGASLPGDRTDGV